MQLFEAPPMASNVCYGMREVDSVMIDPAYDGKVFNITLADVPEKKNDLVEGKYVVEANKGATVAVKVTNILGEEVLVVRGV